MCKTPFRRLLALPLPVGWAEVVSVTLSETEMAIRETSIGIPKHIFRTVSKD